jgi:thermostable 8-oxoguanine DNA glycosylase
MIEEMRLQQAIDNRHWTLTWSIPEEQLATIREFYLRYEKSPMVNQKRDRNVNGQHLDFSRNNFLKAILCCLCTSQQRSGPESKVARFLRLRPFPITESFCRSKKENLSDELKNQLSVAGIRFSKQIAEYFTENLSRLDASQWQILKELNDYNTSGNIDEAWERKIATTISAGRGPGNHKLTGFGPKQARNLLQIMGVGRFEVPLDSRVLDWLVQHGFPYVLSDRQMIHPAFYELLVDSIKDISGRIGVYPCLLDAAIFAAVDGDGWTNDNLIF